MDRDKIKAVIEKLKARYWAKGDSLDSETIDLIRSLRTECDNQETRIADLEEALEDAREYISGEVEDSFQPAVRLTEKINKVLKKD